MLQGQNYSWYVQDFYLLTASRKSWRDGRAKWRRWTNGELENLYEEPNIIIVARAQQIQMAETYTEVVVFLCHFLAISAVLSAFPTLSAPPYLLSLHVFCCFYSFHPYFQLDSAHLCPARFCLLPQPISFFFIPFRSCSVFIFSFFDHFSSFSVRPSSFFFVLPLPNSFRFFPTDFVFSVVF